MNYLDLQNELEASRESFLELIEGLSDDELIQPGVCGSWSIKDIMAHLTRWEAELVKLLWQLSMSQEPTTAHFSQTPVDGLNDQWFKEMQTRPMDRILEDFHGVRTQTIRRLESFSDKMLEDKKHYPWSGGRALWEWVASDSFEHESEHAGQIKAWRLTKGPV